MKDNIILLPLTKEEIEVLISACYINVFETDNHNDIVKLGKIVSKLEELEGEL